VLVAEEEHAEEAGVDVEAIQAHGVVVEPKAGGVLFEGIVASEALAGDEPVIGVAVVFRGDGGTVDVDNGTDVGNVSAAAVEAVVNGQEVLVRELIDPLDVEWLLGMGLDERRDGRAVFYRRNRVGVDPEAGGGKIAVDFGVDLSHGDAKFVRCDGLRARGQREGVDEGGKFERVQHPEGIVGRATAYGRRHPGHRVVLHLACEADMGAAEEAECGCFLDKVAAGWRQASDLRDCLGTKKYAPGRGAYFEGRTIV
jgi:hypothetical protein